jgi:hypothetical protein
MLEASRQGLVRGEATMVWVGRRSRSSLLGWLVAALAVGCVVLALAGEARGQDSQGQQSSVADAARRAKQKKASGKGAKVIDDDNLSSNLKSGGPDVTNVGASAAATANPGAAANAQAGDVEAAAEDPGSTKKNQDAAARDEQNAKEQDEEIAKVKAQVAETEKELDLLKREFALDSEAYYSKTDYSNDKAGKAKLDAQQQQISDKQHELDGVKARLAALLQQPSRRKGRAAAASAEAEKPATPPQR